MIRKTRRAFGRGERRGDPALEGAGLLRRWRSLRVGHRAAIVMFGGASSPLVVGSLQLIGHIPLPFWLNLLGMACAIAGLLYAITRRCPGCDADGVFTLWDRSAGARNAARNF
jgi:hypothetical protein